MIEVYVKKRPGEAPELFRTSKSSVVIGRKNADWVLDYDDVSRQHCRLYVKGAQVYVEPLKATNPVAINQVAISGPKPLNPGDELAFGMCRLRLAAGAPEGVQPVLEVRGAERVRREAERSRGEAQEQAQEQGVDDRGEKGSEGGDDGLGLDKTAGVWIREQARRWELLGRPERLLLRGVRLQRAIEELAGARRGRDAALVQLFFDRSVAQRRARLMMVASWVVVVVVSSGFGFGLAHGFGGEPVDTTPQTGNAERRCSEQKLAEAQTIAEKAAMLGERRQLLGGVFAAVVGEESRCRGGLALEDGARALLRDASDIELHASAAALVIARSPDGHSVAIASERGVEVFGFSERKPLSLDESSDVTALAWSGDSRWLATGDREGVVALRDARQEPMYSAIHRLEEHRGEITQITYSPDGNWVATGDSAGDVRLWSVRGSEIGELRGRKRASGKVRALVFDSQGAQLYVHSGELVTRWTIDRAARREVLGKRRVLAGDVTAMEVIRDGSAVLTGHLDGQIKMWRPQGRRGKLQARSIRRGSGAAVVGLAFVPGRDEIVVATAKAELGLVDLQASVREDAFTYSRFSDPASRPRALTIDASGRLALTVGDDVAEVWDIAGRLEQPIETITAPEGGWTAVGLPGQRSTALFGGDDGVVRGRDIFAGSSSGASYALGAQNVMDYALDDVGDTIVTLSRDEKSVVLLWSLGAYGRPTSPRRIEVDARLDKIVVSGDGRLVAGTGNGRVYVWDVAADGALTGELALPGVERVSFAGKGVLVAAGPDRLRRWKIKGTRPDPASDEDVVVDGRIFSLAASDTYVAVGTESSKEGQLLAWQLVDLQHPVIEERMPRAVDRVVFSEHGGHLAASSKDNLVKTWRLRGSEADLAPSFTADSQVMALAFSPSSPREETFVALGTQLGTVNIWSLDKEARFGWQAHEGQINGVTFGASEQVLVTADNKGAIHKWIRFDDGGWSEEDSVKIGTVPGGALETAAASSGRALAVLSGDGTVQSWSVDGASLLHRACASVGWLKLDESDWRHLGMKPRVLCTAH